MRKTTQPVTLLAALALALPLLASAANPIQDSYRAQARQENPAFKDFSAAAGQKLYNSKGAELSCASCHTDSPLAAGKHAKTNKDILPLAPAANPKRFSDAAQVEKWFKRNCNEVLSRACSAQEKGDFMAYVLSVK
jgi:mono/diheme cytochrome c family protein